MQKLRIFECPFIKPMHYVKALLGLSVLCSFAAQGASNTATTSDAQPNKAAVTDVAGESHKVDADTPVAEKSRLHVSDLSTVTQLTMEQSIEAARKRKIRELDEAFRKQLGESASDVGPVSPANPMRPSITKLPESAVPNAAPRLWSLTASGNRVWAEVVFDGRIIQLDAMDGLLIQLDSDEGLPELGAWTVLALTDDGLVLGRKIKVSNKKGKRAMQQERMLLRPPSRGISVATYKFNQPGMGSTSALIESAQRAAQLPFHQPGTQK